jgi:hypothetical protein
MPFKPIKTFRQLQNRFCPFSYQYTSASDYQHLIRKINLYFKLNPRKKTAYKAELEYLSQHSNLDKSVTMVWPYPFVKAYEAKNIEVYKDTVKDLFYVLQNGRKLYYSRKYNSVEAVQESYNSLVVEQHANSPHLYLKKGFDVAEGDFVLDIGAAEGNFSLDIVERAGKVIIIEAEEHWIEALNATFEPWKEKVEIIHKYISDTNSNRCATLKSIVGEQSVDFLKLDVEGAELSILNSSAELLRRKQIKKVAVCTYHKKNDEKQFSQLLQDYGYEISQTPGIMLFVYGKLTPPYFRKVLLQAVAKS